MPPVSLCLCLHASISPGLWISMSLCLRKEGLHYTPIGYIMERKIPEGGILNRIKPYISYKETVNMEKELQTMTDLQETDAAAYEASGADSLGAGNTEAEKSSCCCGERRKTRSEKEYKDLLNRLSRIEGQIRGLKGMVEKDAYCIDILNQASAASSALSSFCKVLLSSHIRTCVTEDVRDGHEEKVDELVKTLQKMMR